MVDALTPVITKEIKEEAFNLCQRLLGGPWNEILVDEFKLSPVSGGLSNILYHCSLPETTVVKNCKIPKEVLLRFYGPVQEDPNVVVKEAVTFMLLSEKNLGPKLYGIFPKGRLEEYIPSRTLSTDDIRKFSTLIAKEMAKIHALQVPVKKSPDMLAETMLKWLQDLEELPAKSSDISLLLNLYREEIQWLLSEIKKSSSPAVYCHNDLQGGNILLREDKPKIPEPKLMLIDFEFGAYNYRGFDIANQFIEWCYDYSTEEYPHFKHDLSKFPSEQEQIQYITAYLEQLQEEGITIKNTLQDEIKKILEEVKLFQLAALLIWSMWSVRMVTTSTIEVSVFAHREHGKSRRKWYQTCKEQYLKSPMCNGEMALTGKED